jgi:hypothetical protein
MKSAAHRYDEQRLFQLPWIVLLLAGTGTALVVTGAILSWEYGAVVQFGNAVLVALAWCF